MKTNIHFIILSSLILYSCAVQSIPTGGPPDKIGPYIKEVSPPNGSINILNSQNIEISFNEMVDPKKVKSSIDVYPEIDISISSITNKVILKPKENWPDGIIKINISRDITDYNGNLMKKSYILNYSTSASMPVGEISGKLFNTGTIDIHEVGLYKVIDKQLKLICITQSNYENKFTFNNVLNGDYLVIAMQGIIKNATDDIRKNKYSLSSKIISIKDNRKDNVLINFNNPAYRKNVKSFIKENDFYGSLQFDDGTSINIVDDLLNQNNNSNDISTIFYENENKLDSINVDIILNNNIEYYNLTKTLNIKDKTNDITNPYIQEVEFSDGTLTLFFSEPIFINGNEIFSKVLNDSIVDPIDFIFLEPMKIMIKEKLKKSDVINIKNQFVVDVSKNNNVLIDSSIVIEIEEFSISNEVNNGGNIFGKILYSGSNEIIVEAINIKNGNRKNTIANMYGDYKLFDLSPGMYQIWAYENINDVNNSYFNGLLEPLRLSAKFNYYNELIETRARWDIEQIDIIIN